MTKVYTGPIFTHIADCEFKIGQSIRFVYDEVGSILRRERNNCYGRPLLRVWMLPGLNTIPNNCVRENSLAQWLWYWLASRCLWFKTCPDLIFLPCIYQFICFFVTNFVRKVGASSGLAKEPLMPLKVKKWTFCLSGFLSSITDDFKRGCLPFKLPGDEPIHKNTLKIMIYRHNTVKCTSTTQPMHTRCIDLRF